MGHGGYQPEWDDNGNQFLNTNHDRPGDRDAGTEHLLAHRDHDCVAGSAKVVPSKGRCSVPALNGAAQSD